MTHDQSEMKSLPVMRLEEVENAAWHVDVIAIDEGQFLPGMWESPQGVRGSLKASVLCGQAEDGLPLTSTKLLETWKASSQRLMLQICSTTLSCGLTTASWCSLRPWTPPTSAGPSRM